MERQYMVVGLVATDVQQDQMVASSQGVKVELIWFVNFFALYISRLITVDGVVHYE